MESLPRSRLDAAKQIYQLNVQRACHPRDVDQGGIPFSALNPSDVCSIKLGELGQSLLSDAASVSELPDSATEVARKSTPLHGAMVRPG